MGTVAGIFVMLVAAGALLALVKGGPHGEGGINGLASWVDAKFATSFASRTASKAKA